MDWLESLHRELLHGASFGHLWSGLNHRPLRGGKGKSGCDNHGQLAARLSSSATPCTQHWHQPFSSFSLLAPHHVASRLLTKLTLGAMENPGSTR